MILDATENLPDDRAKATIQAALERAQQALAMAPPEGNDRRRHMLSQPGAAGYTDAMNNLIALKALGVGTSVPAAHQTRSQQKEALIPAQSIPPPQWQQIPVPPPPQPPRSPPPPSQWEQMQTEAGAQMQQWQKQASGQLQQVGGQLQEQAGKTAAWWTQRPLLVQQAAEAAAGKAAGGSNGGDGNGGSGGGGSSDPLWDKEAAGVVGAAAGKNSSGADKGASLHLFRPARGGDGSTPASGNNVFVVVPPPVQAAMGSEDAASPDAMKSEPSDTRYNAPQPISVVVPPPVQAASGPTDAASPAVPASGSLGINQNGERQLVDSGSSVEISPGTDGRGTVSLGMAPGPAAAAAAPTLTPPPAAPAAPLNYLPASYSQPDAAAASPGQTAAMARQYDEYQQFQQLQQQQGQQQQVSAYAPSQPQGQAQGNAYAPSQARPPSSAVPQQSGSGYSQQPQPPSRSAAPARSTAPGPGAAAAQPHRPGGASGAQQQHPTAQPASTPASDNGSGQPKIEASSGPLFEALKNHFHPCATCSDEPAPAPQGRLLCSPSIHALHLSDSVPPSLHCSHVLPTLPSSLPQPSSCSQWQPPSSSSQPQPLRHQHRRHPSLPLCLGRGASRWGQCNHR